MNPILEPLFSTPSLSDGTTSPIQPYLGPKTPPFIHVVQFVVPRIPIMEGRGQRGPPPLVNPWIPIRYGPLSVLTNSHDMPEHYLKIFPNMMENKISQSKNTWRSF